MGYKWKPSKSQRREFAIRMQDPEEQAEYNARKEQAEKKRRATSSFDYNKAGGYYIPTKGQSDFCLSHMELFITSQEKEAANFVISGYACNEKIHHDYIHIVNEKKRTFVEL
jgi:hypothetical protein